MKLSTKELVIFALDAAIMYASKVIMSALPNIHLLAFFIIIFSIVYRKKALYIVYGYVFLEGLMSGFALWWIPYLYIWTILWIIAIHLPKKPNPILCSILGFCHGMAFGTLYAPAQAILFGLSFDEMIAWIIVGLPWDLTHGISNTVVCSLVPLGIKVVQSADKHHD